MNLQWSDVGRSGFAWLDDAIQSVLAKINAIWNVQHNGDGTHSAVTCDTLSIGAVGTSRLGNVTGSLVPTTATQDLGANLTQTGGTGVQLPFRTLYVTTIDFETYSATSISFTPTLTGTRFTNDAASAFVFSMLAGIDTHTLTIGAGLTGLTSNRLITGVGLSSTNDCSATTGYFERSRSTRSGDWAAPTFAAGDYTASAGTWIVAIGNVTLLRFTRNGTSLTINFRIDSTSVSATPGQLRIALPLGLTAANDAYNSNLTYNDNGAGFAGGGSIFTQAGLKFIILQKVFGTSTWAASAGATSVNGQITLETTT